MQDRTSWRPARTLGLVLSVALVGACTQGTIQGGGSPGAAAAPGAGTAGVGGPGVGTGVAGGTATGTGTGAAGTGLGFTGPTGMHRLTRLEYDATVRDLLGDTTRPG